MNNVLEANWKEPRCVLLPKCFSLIDGAPLLQALLPTQYDWQLGYWPVLRWHSQRMFVKKTWGHFSQELAAQEYVCFQNQTAIKKKLLELINKFSRYKINMQSSVVFLYISNGQSKKEIKNTILFPIVSKRIKYLRRNMTKEA